MYTSSTSGHAITTTSAPFTPRRLLPEGGAGIALAGTTLCLGLRFTPFILCLAIPKTHRSSCNSCAFIHWKNKPKAL